MKSNIPNLITLSRLCLVPLIAGWILQSRLFMASLALLASGALDIIDGWSARKMEFQTEFGAKLDGTADGILICAALLALVRADFLPLWLALPIIFLAFLTCLLSWMIHEQLVKSKSFSRKTGRIFIVLMYASLLGIMWQVKGSYWLLGTTSFLAYLVTIKGLMALKR